MKLGLVVPRYGTEVVGGTEHWLRNLCEHLVRMRGWQAEVFTTCASSAATWADDYPPGTTEINGVTVHRHPARSGRDPRYLESQARVAADPGSVPEADARRFIELVGPVCPDAVDDAADSDCDLVAVTPYLFWPSVEAARRLGRRVLFHGAAHDEPELRLAPMREVFASVGGFSFNSFAERDLVYSCYRVAHLPASVIGNAVVESVGDPVVARSELGLGPDEPFVLCVGRVERSKGSHVLADMWELYRARRPGTPRLVFLGPVNEPLAGSPGVVVAGARDENVKWGALRGCELVIAPSAWESFSLVVVEAWLAGRAVVVNGRCPATVEHCTRSGGGVWFDGYAELEVAVDRLLADEPLRGRMAETGQAYARSQFDWPTITDRYSDLAGRVLSAWSG